MNNHFIICLTAIAWLAIPPVITSAANNDKKILSGPQVKPGGVERQKRGFDGGKRSNRADRLAGFLADLNLNDQQMAEARQIMAKQHSQLKAWRKKHSAELQKLESEMRKLHERRRKLMANAPKPHSGLERLRPMLNSEQQKNLDLKIEKHKRHGKRRGATDRNRPRTLPGKNNASNDPQSRRPRKPSIEMDNLQTSQQLDL